MGSAFIAGVDRHSGTTTRLPSIESRDIKFEDALLHINHESNSVIVRAAFADGQLLSFTGETKPAKLQRFLAIPDGMPTRIP